MNKSYNPLGKLGKKAKIVISILTIFVAITFIVVMIIGDSGSSQPTQPLEVKPTCLESYIISQTYVERILKSPSTAEFINYKCMVKGVDIENNKRYIVLGEVDSQNSFGAIIRNAYTINTDYLGGEWSEIKNWKLNILVFDGEVIIDNTMKE